MAFARHEGTRKKGWLFPFPLLTLEMLEGEPGQALALLSSAPAAERQGDPAAGMAFLSWYNLPKPTTVAGILICHLASLNLGLLTFPSPCNE